MSEMTSSCSLRWSVTRFAWQHEPIVIYSSFTFISSFWMHVVVKVTSTYDFCACAKDVSFDNEGLLTVVIM